MLEILHRLRGSQAPEHGDIAESCKLSTETTVFNDQVRVGRHDVKFSLEIPRPSNRLYEGIAFIEPGFGGVGWSSDNLMHALAVRGVATLRYDPVRRDNDPLLFRLLEPQAVHTDTVTALARHVPNNNRLVHEVPEIKSYDLFRHAHLPHSMGGHPATEHSSTNKENTDVIINLATVGLGSPTLAQLARNLPAGIPRGIFNEFIPGIFEGYLEVSAVNLASSVKYFFHNPIRTISEAMSCLTADLRPAIRRLGESGVKTAFIGFERDCLIPPNDEIANDVDRFSVIPRLGHMAPQVKPNEVANQIVKTIEDFGLAAA